MSTTSSQNPDAKRVAIDLQAQELLFYKKIHMRNALAKRVNERVEKISASRPDSHAYAEQLAAREVLQHQHGQKKHNVAPVPVAVGQRPAKRSSTTSLTTNPKRVSPERPSGHQIPPEPPIPTATATYVPWARQVPHLHAPRIPQTIVSEWHRLTSVPLGAIPNTPTCMCACCPFTSGPPLQRRYNLLLAMINLENYLIGM